MGTIGRVASISETRSCLWVKCDKLVDDYLSWPYFFLDTSTPMAGVWYLGLVSAEILFFFVSFLGRSCLDRCFGRSKESLMDVGIPGSRVIADSSNSFAAQWLPSRGKQDCKPPLL